MDAAEPTTNQAQTGGRQPPSAAGGRSTWWLVGAILVGYLVLGIAFSLAVPPFETPDEPYHYAFARHIAQGNGLPVQDDEATGPWQQEGSQAPLYYLLTGWLTAGIDQSDFDALNVVNPRANMGDPLFPGNKNRMLYSAAPRPLAGANLALHVGRWFSLLLGACTLVCVYLTARLAFAGSRTLPVLAMLTVAAIPQFLFISASFTNDTLIIAVSAATVYWLARLLARTGDAPIRAWEWLVLGLLLGIAALSKLQGLGLGLLAAGVALWLAWRRRDARLLVTAGAVVGLTVVAVAGWWYWRNHVLYGDWLGVSHLIAINGRREESLSLGGLWPELRGLRYSFWGLFGWFNTLLPGWLYGVLDVLALLAVAGLLLAFLLPPTAAGSAPGTRRVRLLLLAWVLLSFGLVFYWITQATGGQGRLVFPGLIGIGILLVAGLEFWLGRLPDWAHTAGRLALPAVLLLATVYTLLFLLPSAYAAPAPVGAVPPTAQAMDIRYGDRAPISLLGIDLPTGRFQPGDRVPITLYLRADQPLDDDYQLFIQLLDEQGQELGNVTTHPGWGRHPTRLWQPGASYADAYSVRIDRPIDPRSPLLARVYAGFIDPATAESELHPLPARTAGGEEITPFLGAVVIHPSKPDILEDADLRPVDAAFGDAIELAGVQAPARVDASTASMTVTLGWRTLAAPGNEYTAYVHLVDEAGHQVAGFDQAPAAGRFPTQHWQPGDQVLSDFVVELPAGLSPGAYRLWAGLYESGSQGAVRLPVTDGGEASTEHNQVLVATIQVD